VFRVFGGSSPVVLSLFLLICLMFAPPLIMIFCHTFCVLVFRRVGYFSFEIRSQCLAAILFGVIWCFSGVPGVRSALLIWSYSLVGRSLLIQDRESVLWLKLGFGFFMVSFGGSEVERWCKLYDLLDRSFAEVAQLWCSGLGVLFRGVFF